MKTHLDCVPCLMRQSLEAARNVSPDPAVHERIVRQVLRMIAELDLDLPPPYAGQLIHRKLREMTGVKDPYRAAKSHFNRLAMDSLPQLSAVVRKSPDPLLAAAQLSVAANAIDMGVASALTEAEVRAALCGSPAGALYGDGDRFHKAVAEATNILYLADNAGEIAVDRLLVQQLGPERVTVAVRGAPVLNDATLTDAREVDMHELVEVIDNGSDAPGTILDDCSHSFRERFSRADLIIAKGQGNYETLSGVERNIVFLFKVKCPLISRHVALPQGTHTLFQPEHGQA